MITSPHVYLPVSVRAVMAKVLVALVPGIAAYVWFFGGGILVTLALATLAALAAEALMLKLRGKPLAMFLTDGSAAVTAWLVALAFPPLSPWWLIVAATLFAIVVAKHLYGGLGQNPFNPAMAAFAVMIVAFPGLMSQWPAAAQPLPFAEQLRIMFAGARHLDAMVMATPLDALRTAFASGEGRATVATALAAYPGGGLMAGKGWEWIALGYAVGGLWLLQQRIFTWHVPTAFLGTLALISGAFHVAAPERFATPLFHLFGGAAMLGAFFIATDPVSGAITPRGKLIFAAGAALITYFIRVFGAYPDGVAFGILLMNMCVPLIDMKTQPPVFGRKDGNP
ncbi:MAG: RnfABCDGE type electron transport complex subunit D [Pseudomonadota bacterium]|jgi:electron transport complex protein RnfD